MVRSATAHALEEASFAAPVAWRPARRRRRLDRRAPWPGDITPDAEIAAELADVAAWVNGPASPARKYLALAVGATLSLDLACLLMRLVG